VDEAWSCAPRAIRHQLSVAGQKPHAFGKSGSPQGLVLAHVKDEVPIDEFVEHPGPFDRVSDLLVSQRLDLVLCHRAIDSPPRQRTQLLLLEAPQQPVVWVVVRVAHGSMTANCLTAPCSISHRCTSRLSSSRLMPPSCAARRQNSTTASGTS